MERLVSSWSSTSRMERGSDTVRIAFTPSANWQNEALPIIGCDPSAWMPRAIFNIRMPSAKRRSGRPAPFQWERCGRKIKAATVK